MRRLSVGLFAAAALVAPASAQAATLSKPRAQAAMLVAVQSPVLEEAKLTNCYRRNAIQWVCTAHVTYEGAGGEYTTRMVATLHRNGRVSATTL
jgi:hypothetical protein